MIAGIGIVGADNTKINLNQLNKINLEHGYKLSVLDADARSTPRLATLELKKGNDVQVQTVFDKNAFSFYDNNGILVVSGTLDSVFSRAMADMIQIRYLTQFDQSGNIIAYFDKITLIEPY